MKSFTCIQVQRKTAVRFRVFSKKIAKTHSEALELVMHFFETNQLSPRDSMGSSIHTLESLIKKRVNGLVAILKNIEREQTLPTTAMLQTLFEGTPIEQEETLVEIESNDPSFETDSVFENPMEDFFMYQKEKELEIKDLHQKNRILKTDLQTFLENSKLVSTTFGKDYFKLEVSSEVFENIKNHL